MNILYPVTPVLSVDGLHDNITLVAVKPEEVRPDGALGAVVSRCRCGGGEFMRAAWL